MSKLTDSVTKNFSAAKKKEFFKRLNELSGLMTEESAVDLVLSELFKEGYAKGGRVNFDKGGIFSLNPDEAVKFNLDGEIINLIQFFGMFLILIGVYWANKKKSK